MEARALPSSLTHTLPVLGTSHEQGKGKGRGSPALQLVPLSLPPRLIIVTDYLTASPTVTCFGLTDYAIWATWPGSEPREVTERGKWL